MPIISYDMGEFDYMFIYDGKGNMLFYGKIYTDNGHECIQELIKKLEKVFSERNFQLCYSYSQWNKLNHELLKKAPQKGEELVEKGFLKEGYNIVGTCLEIHLEDGME